MAYFLGHPVHHQQHQFQITTVQVRCIRCSLDVESVKTMLHFCHITSRLLQFGPGVCGKKMSQTTFNAFRMLQGVWSQSNTETRAWSFTAVARWPALADYSTAGAVPACRDCSSVSSVTSSKVPRRLLRASLKFSAANISVRPAVANWIFLVAANMASRLSQSPRPDGLELTAWFVAWSGCRVWTLWRDLKTHLFAGH